MSFNITPYITADDAQTYFDGKLNTDAWDEATSAKRAKALVEATNRIDRLQFAGVRTADYTTRLAAHNSGSLFDNRLTPSNSGQPREFPRDGASTVPDEILAACCEIAYALLDGVDPELEMQNLSTVQHGFAALQETYDPRIVNLAFKHGIPSITAWNYLVPFLQDPFEVQLRRV